MPPLPSDVSSATTRKRGFRDIPVGLKIATAVGALGLVAIVISVLSVMRLTDLDQSGQQLAAENVTPMGVMSEIQSGLMGDRARHLTYAYLSEDERPAAKEDLATRRADLDALLAEYEPHIVNQEAMAQLDTELAAYYAFADSQVVDVVDSGDLTEITANVVELGALGTAAMDTLTLEVDAEIAQADEHTSRLSPPSRSS